MSAPHAPDVVSEVSDLDKKERSWSEKFRHAIRGLRVGSQGQSSFLIHVPIAFFVLAAAAQLRVTNWEWCLLILCIVLVLTAELLNGALESLARAVTDQENPAVRDALDIASAAVLMAAVGATIIGLLILGFRLAVALGWVPTSYVG